MRPVARSKVRVSICVGSIYRLQLEGCSQYPSFLNVMKVLVVSELRPAVACVADFYIIEETLTCQNEMLYIIIIICQHFCFQEVYSPEAIGTLY
jgi:hypothetical protein